MKQIRLNAFYKAALLLSFIIVSVLSCQKPDPEPDPESGIDPGDIQGAPGNPRFNLQFTNGDRTDVDLYVETPDGSVIYYNNPSGQNGKLDVDCLCGDCPNGPNENIYWTPGTAPTGTYRVWAEYYESCDGTNASSNYTIRVMNNSDIIKTYTGTLTPGNANSPVYTFNFQ